MKTILTGLVAGLFFFVSNVASMAIPYCHSSDDRYSHVCELIPHKAKAHKTAKIKAVAKAKQSNGKTAVLIQGLMGGALAPMNDIAQGLRAKGYQVRSTSFHSPDLRGASVVIGHSMGCFPALRSNVKKIILVDCPIWAHPMPNAPKGASVANFYTLAHPKVYGAINVPIRANHLSAPTVAKRHIMALI